MPFVAQVAITGSGRSAEEGAALIEAFAAALAQGWDSGWPDWAFEHVMLSCSGQIGRTAFPIREVHPLSPFTH